MKKMMVMLTLILVISVSTAQAVFFDKNPASGGQSSGQPAGQSSGLSFEQMMNMLSINCALWGQLSDENKKKAVEGVIQLYRVRDNIAILGAADFYVRRVNETLAGDPGVVYLDLPRVIKIIAVMEYDFYNGQNKDELAKETLGEKAFESNRLRKMVAGR